jgi:hypothetical protein
MMLGKASPKAERPYNRKNRIKHQVAIELGILISFSFKTDKGSASLLFR